MNIECRFLQMTFYSQALTFTRLNNDEKVHLNRSKVLYIPIKKFAHM